MKAVACCGDQWDTREERVRMQARVASNTKEFTGGCTGDDQEGVEAAGGVIGVTGVTTLIATAPDFTRAVRRRILCRMGEETSQHRREGWPNARLVAKGLSAARVALKMRKLEQQVEESWTGEKEVRGPGNGDNVQSVFVWPCCSLPDKPDPCGERGFPPGAQRRAYVPV